MTSKGATWANREFGSGATGSGSQRFLGFPLEGFGFFTSLLLTFSSGFLAFWLVTGVAIFALLIWNQGLHHSVNYANSYLYAGLPAAIVVWAIALGVFGTLWVRAILQLRRQRF